MNFRVAIIKCFMLYAVFSGRAKRSEYWWFVLFSILGNVFLGIIDAMLGLIVNGQGILSSIFGLFVIIPGLAVCSRRLHDTNRSGWLQGLFIIPLVGFFFMIRKIIEYENKGFEVPTWEALLTFLFLILFLGCGILVNIIFCAQNSINNPGKSSNKYGEDTFWKEIIDE